MSEPKLNIKEETSAKKTRSPPKKAKAEQTVPKKKKLKTDADKAAEKAQHLRFGKAELTPDELSRLSKAQKREMYAAHAARSAVHHEVDQYEDENVGVQALSESEKAAGNVRDISKSRYARKLKKKAKMQGKKGARTAKSSVQKPTAAQDAGASGTSEGGSNWLSRWKQRQEIHKSYYTAAHSGTAAQTAGGKAASNGASAARSSMEQAVEKGKTAVSTAVKGLANAAKSNAHVLVIVGVFLLLILMVMKKNKFEFIIDSEFQSQIPALTDEEFQQLEENILSEGEVLSPLIVWGNILVDGHNRYKILQQHPEIPYTTRSISCTCETREDVLAWICKHQLGRRNLTPEQKKFLIGKQYHSEKSTRGGNHGNQYTQVANCQIDNLPPVENTTERIAKENNVSPSFVIRAEQFMKTVELMEKYCPGIQEEILSGKLKLSQREATIIRGTPTEALPTVVSTWREKKLNGKPNDSADTYENSELLSKVTERNFSTAATSKIQTADPLSENRPFISSGKRCTELQTIREPGEKMATVDSILEIDNTVSSTTNENQQDAVDTTLAA